MSKKFYEWIILKEQLNEHVGEIYAHQREIWWCSLGINIGAEIDGKNVNFERPVLILRVYGSETLLILPMTSKAKDDIFHYPLKTGLATVWLSLTQIRVISSKRLIRKIKIISNKEFCGIKEALQKYL